MSMRAQEEREWRNHLTHHKEKLAKVKSTLEEGMLALYHLTPLSPPPHRLTQNIWPLPSEPKSFLAMIYPLGLHALRM